MESGPRDKPLETLLPCLGLGGSKRRKSASPRPIQTPYYFPNIAIYDLVKIAQAFLNKGLRASKIIECSGHTQRIITPLTMHVLQNDIAAHLICLLLIWLTLLDGVIGGSTAERARIFA
jgi:hypothetical protein